LKNNIKQLIIDWHHKELPQIYERNFPKINFKNLENILAIIWPRRAGKTYYMYQLINELMINYGVLKDEILFIDFENYKLIELQTQDMGEILDLFYEVHGKYPKYLFFDEIHTVEHRGRVLRTFHNDGYTIIISWSSSKLLLSEISTELRGRYFHQLMLPFSFKELVVKHQISFNHTIQYDQKKRIKVRKLFDEYLEFWWYPVVVWEENEERKRTLLEEYYATIFYKDLLERHIIQDKKAVECLMHYFLNTYSNLFSASKFEIYLKNLWIKVSKATLLKYVDYIQESFFTISCPKFSRSPKWEIHNPSKIYLIDSGFTRMGNNYTENKGQILENIVAIELYRQEKQFFYFNGKKECDFIVKDKIGTKITSVIQVCWQLDEINQEREIKGLLLAMNTCNVNEWYILTYDTFEEREVENKKIHILPVWYWMNLS